MGANQKNSPSSQQVTQLVYHQIWQVLSMLLFRKYIQTVQAAAVLHHCSWSPANQHSIIWIVQLIQHFQQAMQTVVWPHTVRMCHHLHHHSVKQQLNVMFKQTECWFKWFRTVTWHSRRKTRRQDPESRQDPEIRQKEQSHNTNRRKACRQDVTYKRQESAWRREHGRSTTAVLVSYFHQLISSGPVYICTACDQMFYKHNVKKVSSIRSLALPVLDTVLLGKISSNGNEYVCHTYAKYSHQNKIPPCSIANNLQFPELPLHLPRLNTAEWRMLSPRLAFMQIHETAVGKQLRIHGNVVCVPADVCTTVSMLPRTTSDFQTVAVQLKRRSQYQHPVLSSNVRPACIREVGTNLVEHGELFKQEKISFSSAVLHSVQTDEILTVSGRAVENIDNTFIVRHRWWRW